MKTVIGCGFAWDAPFVRAPRPTDPAGKVWCGVVRQECALEDGHLDNHRSVSNSIYIPGMVFQTGWIDYR